MTQGDPSDKLTFNMEAQDEIEKQNRVINEEYKVWKKSSPFLYDMILTSALEWPTLTTQWFPDVKDDPEKSYVTQRLLLGTHTAEGMPNYLQIAEVELPKPGKPNPKDYDEERGEIGGYGSKSSSSEIAAMRFKIVQKIDHPTEVNKARYQPQNPDVIATLASDGRILVFDRTHHSLEPSGTVNPQAELVGHTKEGFALAWSPFIEGQLVSGSEDETVCLWDLKDISSTNTTLNPTRRFTHHTQIVNDVQYHPVARHLIGSVSDDLTLQIVDVRKEDNHQAVLTAKNGHSDAINVLAFSPTSEYLVSTGSADNTIGIWDLRNVNDKIHTLEGHRDAVTSMSWHPNLPGVIGSGSYDRRFLVWDLTRVGEEQTPEDSEDGPPELLFMHGGHTNHLSDFSWNPVGFQPWVICSADESNMLHIFQIAQAALPDDDAEIPINEVDAEAN